MLKWEQQNILIKNKCRMLLIMMNSVSCLHKTFHLISLLIRRMLPSSSRMLRLNNLMVGTAYSLCVVALYDDASTALTASNMLGCVDFATSTDFMHCTKVPSHFLGGTMIIVVHLYNFTVRNVLLKIWSQHFYYFKRNYRGRK